ncbi:hypothetical protein LBMAG53_29680 [Planctomycetota bacterium]|nr:hypothetical protein LBMAG53_29680 [Planctomycetota bacterium]
MSNLKQIGLAIRTYQNAHDGDLPVWLVDAEGRTTTGKPDGLATTAASLELLFRWSGGELRPQVLRCLSQRKNRLPPELGMEWDRSAWAAAIHAGTWEPAYVYDWAASPSMSAGRVLLADRFSHVHVIPETTWQWATRYLGFVHQRQTGSCSHSANAVFGDMHFQPVRGLTCASDERITGGHIHGLPGDDDPWTSTDDGGDPWCAGGGSATRCYLR